MINLFKDPDNLVRSLTQFTDPIYEAGGFVLVRDNKYLFQEVPNQHKGTEIGRALYAPVDTVFAKLIGPYFRDKWNIYASFHTHPSFTARYSGIDYQNLFQNSKYNYIKSVRYGEIVKYEWLDEENIGSRVILVG